MPAAVIKGVLVSISIVTALSIVVLENPQVQAWLEQQRRKIAELLRSIGEDLDPQSRRAAEAFAYEGRTPATDLGLRREASGSREAAAIATGSSLASGSTIRRIPIKGPADPNEAEERRRKGREYLAKRNQQMYELKQRKQATTSDESPPSPTSFDAMVDNDGKLRMSDSEKDLPSPPAIDPLPAAVEEETREMEIVQPQPLLANGPSQSTTGDAGWSFGSLLANPFADEFALDRSETPKPPVPPKVAFETPDDPPISTLPGSFTPRQPSPRIPQQDNDLTYEDQLAIALSLSEAEATSSRHPSQAEAQDEDEELRAAIEASLKELSDSQKATSSGNTASHPSNDMRDSQPLVDLTPSSPTIQPLQPMPRSRWESIFDHQYAPTHEPLSLASSRSQPEEEDELYRMTPELTYARLATFNSQHITSPPSRSSMSYDPVREVVDQSANVQHVGLEASFHDAASAAPSPTSTRTMNHEATPQLVDFSEDVPAGARTPTTHSSAAFQTDTESDSDTFASLSEPASRAQSRPRSQISEGEVVDVVEDSDVDMLSDEGDGIVTPDSWSEVGSRDGDSETDDHARLRQFT